MNYVCFCFYHLFFFFPTCLQTVGGPDRPVLEKIPKRAAGATSEDGIATASSLATSAAAVQSNIYNKLSSAMNERG